MGREAARSRSAHAANDAAARIRARYRERTPSSGSLFDRAAMALAGGPTGNLRHVFPYPLYFAQGSGSHVADVDGNDYLDCFLCNGPLLLGHRHAEVLESIRDGERYGSLVVNPPLAIDVAELLQRLVPCAERVRFLNSGTEAVLTAARIARAHTGKSRIVKFFGHYHGQDDQFLVGLGPTATTFGAGVPATAHESTVLVRHDDIDALAEVLGQGDIAAVVLDPAMHSGGLWGSRTAYLQEVRRLSERYGVLLIFDEVITGFRLAAGGAQTIHGVTPDLATFGKALAAGERLSAVAGRAQVMRVLEPGRADGGPSMFQSGTSNDGTVALAAARAALRLYDRLDASGEYAVLAKRGERLANGIRGAFGAHDVPVHVNQLGSMLQLFATSEPPGFERYSTLDPGPLALFYLALINEGFLLSLPSSNHIYLSFAHSDADIDAAVTKVHAVLESEDLCALLRATS